MEVTQAVHTDCAPAEIVALDARSIEMVKRKVAARKSLPKKEKILGAADFRRIALSLPEATQGSHFGNTDFRVGGKIFATLSLAKEGYGVLLLTPEQQEGMVEDEPEIFSPVPNKWGCMGATRVRLSNVTPDILESALRTAWRKRAPQRLLGGQFQL